MKRNNLPRAILSSALALGALVVLFVEPIHSSSADQASGGGTSQSMAAPQAGKPGIPATAGQPAAPAARPALVWQGNQVKGTFSRREEMYYAGAWGVSELRVKTTESGELVRFDYRVLDPAKAAALNDKKTEPALYDPQAGVKLSVPQMENVGKLRQQNTPKAGMTYWMAFSNPTRAVKRGHRVDVVIGSFRATNLIVE